MIAGRGPSRAMRYGPSARTGDEDAACAQMPLLSAGLAAALASARRRLSVVTPGAEFRFPRDHGAHPAYRTEWWYFTGWLEPRTAGRSVSDHLLPLAPSDRPRQPQRLRAAPDRFRACCAVRSRRRPADPRPAHRPAGLRHRRGGRGRHIEVLDWNLDRRPTAVFRAAAHARGFALDLAFTPTQPAMPNGEGGYSRKGPRPGRRAITFRCPSWRSPGVSARR